MQNLQDSVSGAYPPAGDVEAALRELGAECAADLSYAALRGGALAPPGWESALSALDAAGIRDAALDSVVDRLGLSRVLSLDGARAARVASFLEDSLRLGPGRLRRLLLRRPALLETEDAVRDAVAFLRNAGMTRRDIQGVALRWPGLLTVDVDNARGVIDCLCEPGTGFVAGSMRRFMRRAPFVLLYDVEADIRPAVRWLRRQGLEPAQVARGCPHVLGTSVARLDAAVDFLGRDVGVEGDAALRGIITGFPSVLTASVESVMLPALRFLRVELGFERETVTRIVHAFPATLILDVDSEMQQNVEYFRARGVENVGRIVQRLPPILSYDIEADIDPKMRYLEQALGLSPFDVLMFPAYFSYSLRDRIEPRTRFLQSKGMSVAETGLNMALTLTDDQFCYRVARVPLKEYEDFCAQLTVSRASGRISAVETLQVADKSARKGKRRVWAVDAKMPWADLF